MPAGHDESQGVFPLPAVELPPPLPLPASPADQAAAGDGLAGGGFLEQLLGPPGTGPGHQAEGRLMEEQSETGSDLSQLKQSAVFKEWLIEIDISGKFCNQTRNLACKCIARPGIR